MVSDLNLLVILMRVVDKITKSANLTLRCAFLWTWCSAGTPCKLPCKERLGAFYRCCYSCSITTKARSDIFIVGSLGT